MTTAAAAPVRRSALDSVHRRLGGHAGGTPLLRWPLSYGDPDGERRIVAAAIGLAEPGLSDKRVVRGHGALAACRAAGLDGRPGRVTPATDGGISIWAIAEDEAWLTAEAPVPGGPAIAPADFGPVTAHLEAAGVHVTDVSSGWTVLRLAGPRVLDLLEELVPENLAPAVVPDLAIVQAPMAGCRVILARRDHGGIPGFALLVWRDEAEHLWDVFAHLGEAYGLRPVGASALVAAAGGDPAAPGGATR
jgi:aminomethyltransferase